MKKTVILMIVASIVLSLSVSVSAADIPKDGLIGHYKLEGNLKNEVTGVEGEWYGIGFSEPIWSPEERVWYNGVDGACWFNECGDDGFSTLLNPGSRDFTMAAWIADLGIGGTRPFLWYGSQKQYDAELFNGAEAWFGVWATRPANGWDNYGPCFGTKSQDDSTRIGIDPEENLYDEEADMPLAWTHILCACRYTAPEVEGERGTFEVDYYINGELIGTATDVKDPNMGNYEDHGCYIYSNVNFWDAPAISFVDDIVVYDYAFTAEDVTSLYSAYTTPPTYAEMEQVSFSEAETEAPVETEAPTTEAPETEAPATEAPATEAPATEAPAEEKGGCGSAMGAAALVALVATLGCAIIKKH